MSKYFLLTLVHLTGLQGIYSKLMLDENKNWAIPESLSEHAM